jgi:hypothetical protein
MRAMLPNIDNVFRDFQNAEAMLSINKLGMMLNAPEP